MGALVYESTALDEPRLLRPGQKPLGMCGFDRNKLHWSCIAYAPQTRIQTGNLINSNRAAKNEGSFRGGVWTVPSGSVIDVDTAVPYSVATGYPIVLQYRFKYMATGGNETFVSLSGTPTGLHRFSAWYDDAGGRFRMASGTSTANHTKALETGKSYDVVAYFGSTTTWALFVDGVSSGDIKAGSTSPPTVVCDRLKINGQWYEGTEYVYDGSTVEWAYVYQGSSMGLSVAEYSGNTHLKAATKDPYAPLSAL